MRPEIESARRWLDYAESDLEMAAIEPRGKVLLETLCFHAQQAAEKAIKAVMVLHGIDPPRTHNLQTALDLVAADAVTDPVLAAADILSPYAVSSRYPGDAEPVAAEELAEALSSAADVVGWARAILLAAADNGQSGQAS